MVAPTILTLAESLTVYTAAELKERICSSLRSCENLELDLSGVGDIDTAGVQLLVMAKHEARLLGRRLAIVGHSPVVRDVLEFYNLVSYLGDPLIIPATDAAGDRHG